MIIGTGIDIVDKTRIQAMIEKHGEKFIRRILTEKEMRWIPTGNRQAEYLAGRFAVKEAFAKATGFGFGQRLSFHDIEVLRDAAGKPLLEARKEWLSDFFPDRKLRIHVTISHEKKYAIANVILEG